MYFTLHFENKILKQVIIKRIRVLKEIYCFVITGELPTINPWQ